MRTTLRLLLVEDSEDDALLVLHTLQQGGYDITYERIEDAHAMRAALERDAWDLVIGDYALPSFSGLAALEILKEKGIDLPFIILSGTLSEESAVKAMKAGAHDYVMKENLTRLVPAVERELREAAIRRKRWRAEKIQEATYRISESVSLTESLEDLFTSIHTISVELMPVESLYIALYVPNTGEVSFPFYLDQHDSIQQENWPGHELTQYVLRTGRPLLCTPEKLVELKNQGEVGQQLEALNSNWLGVPLKTKSKIIGILAIQSYREGVIYSDEDLDILTFISTQVAMAIERKQSEQALRESEARYRELFENSPISMWEEDFSEVKNYLDELRGNGISNFKAFFDNHPEAVEECMRKIKVLDVNQSTLRLYGAESKEQLMSSLDRVLGQETLDLFKAELIAIADGKTEFEGIGINYKLNGKRIDNVLKWSAAKPYQKNLSRIIISILDISEQKKAEQQIQSQLQRLAALRTVDMTITASLDLRVTLDVLLDQVTRQLRVDAADILLLNATNQLLEYTAGRGFRSNAIARSCLHVGQGYAGMAAIERRTFILPDLMHATDFMRSHLLTGEGFVAYFGVPLIAKGQVKGVLEVFNRRPINPDSEWLDFLETLAGQAAIAVDNAGLFENLQRSNTELAIAYDATLEGWSKALDLRDRETEGHTQRVTDMTVRLAAIMGFTDEELNAIRRGALLHDIGKMGISDNILLKPGPLTKEEWIIMRKHPEYAFELLSPITYLGPALEIPYCHHEKWDGSGYPRGLMGDQIPLAARIFAVVDVWDALRSDRPYRKAWPDDKICNYILEETGKHFDPQLVDLFLDFLKQEHYPGSHHIH